MSSGNKKYKLFSNTEGGKAPCAFFSTPAGCRHGDACKFSHEVVSQKSNANTIEVGSVVSSESEPEKETPVGKSSNVIKKEVVEEENPFLAPGEARENPSNKKKKNRRGKRSEDHLPFANPKKKPKTESSATSAQESSLPLKSPSNATSTSFSYTSLDLPVASFAVPTTKSTKDSADKAKADKPNPKPKLPSYASLDLPVASFSLPTTSGKKDSAKRAKVEENEVEESSDKESSNAASSLDVSKLPLPKSTAIGRKWLKAVKATRTSHRYASDYNFDKYRASDAEAGIATDQGWIKAKPFGKWCADSPQSIAIDCEMCETRDPVSGQKNHKALCRVSIVDAETKDVLLDTLVKPAWPVTDHRTFVNGIKREHLEKVQFTVRHAQAFMMALCSEETVIIGHAVYNDLAAMRMEHQCVVDSACLFKAVDSERATVSLKDLAKSILKKDMPNTHDSVNDAISALDCLVHYVEKDGNVEAVERTGRKSRNSDGKNIGHYACQLLVHRIPKVVDKSHLAKLFLSHSDVQPTEVQPIEFAAGSHGKTHVIFRSPLHARLAFECLEGSKSEPDPSGRLQKKIYLRNKSYIKVRKMAFEPKKDTNKETPRRYSSG